MLPATGPDIFFLNKNSKNNIKIQNDDKTFLFREYSCIIFQNFSVQSIYIYKYSVIKREIIIKLLIIYHIIINVYLSS